jgi:hypothetical protein
LTRCTWRPIIGRVRSRLFRSICSLITALTVLGPAFAEPSTLSIGTSQAGVPLTVHQLGSGAGRVLILGGQHGGPERNTVELVDAILDYFSTTPEALPAGIGLDVLTEANPDGLAIGSRQFVSGVDPNRNWGGTDWRSDAFDSNARFRIGLGGPEPFSEPETRALADWVLATRPALVINYHSAGGFLFGASEFAAMYAEASGYARPTPGSGRSPLGYAASGSMNVWLRETGIPAILVELSTPWYPEVDRNLSALQAVLRRLAAES